MSVPVVMMVMIPPMMMMMMVVVMVPMMMVVMVPMMMVVMVVMMPRHLHAFLRAGVGVRLTLSVERRQDRDGVGNRLQQFSYAGGAQGLIGFL
jgi:hypothetical protein